MLGSGRLWFEIGEDELCDTWNPGCLVFAHQGDVAVLARQSHVSGELPVSLTPLDPLGLPYGIERFVGGFASFMCLGVDERLSIP